MLVSVLLSPNDLHNREKERVREEEEEKIWSTNFSQIKVHLGKCC